jgi:hypothetical protein
MPGLTQVAVERVKVRMRSNLLLLVGIAIGIVCFGIYASLTVAAAPSRKADLKAGEFSTVRIDKQDTRYGLEMRLDGKGKAAGFFYPGHKDPRTYFNDAGMMYTNGWVVISGVYSGTGEGFNIEPPTKDNSMLAIWSDVLGPAIQVRSANAGAESYIFQGLDRSANYTFSVEQNGKLRWGATTRAAMDTNLYRSAAKTLKTDGSLVVGGSQSVHRTPVNADYMVTDTDYYVGVTGASGRRTVMLPTASGKAGRVYIIKDESGGAGTHPITVRALSGQTIDGTNVRTIGTNYGVLRVISSGNDWFGM